jgi:GTP-binding protein
LHCETLALVLLIIDTRIPPSELDASMLEWLQFNQLPFVIVMNKVDKVKKNDLSKMHADLERNYPGIPRIEHSIDSDMHRKELLTIIENAVK